MILVQAFVCGLAGWRAASLLSKEDGPFQIFAIARDIVGIRRHTELNELAKMVACVWCLSVWTTAAFWGLWYVTPIIPGAVAAMGVAIMAERAARP